MTIFKDRIKLAIVLLAMAACLLFTGAFALPFTGAYAEEDEDVLRVRGILSDYAYTRLKEGYDAQTIADIRADVQDNPLYEEELKYILDRAEQVAAGMLVADFNHRQFSTDEDERGVFLQQRGDIKQYGQQLKLLFGLSNYMPTGICADTGEKLAIFV